MSPFQHFPDAMIVTDAALRITAWNAAAERLYERTAAEACGHDLDAVIEPDPTVGATATLRTLVDARAELAQRTPSGRRLWVDCAVGAYGEGRLIVARDVTARHDAEARVQEYQRRLRDLAAELTLAEERQRLELAADLHDHLGQALAMLRLKLMRLKGDAVFCGLDADLEGMQTLLGQAIRYTRSLTFEISPPVLHELGLAPALEWLAEHLDAKQGLTVRLRAEAPVDPLPEAMRVLLFKSVRELLTNVVKHANAKTATIETTLESGALVIAVADDGVGFDPTTHLHPRGDAGTFGLFSILERVRALGGRLEIDARPGAGSRVRLVVPRPAGVGP
jgi:PAS domain S-box-containing protein